MPLPVFLAQVPQGKDSETGDLLAGVSLGIAPRNNPCKGVKGAGLRKEREVEQQNPTGSSDAGVIFQKCPGLRQGGRQAFVI